jgi:hypothetical protein
MRLTGLQSSAFDLNLYVLYGKWLNDHINGFGFAHRGLVLSWRDYDGPECEPNAGKRWSDPSSDPYLRSFAFAVPTVTKLCQKLHPGERYYLTDLQARGLNPRDVRAWVDDLWLFPYYTDPKTIPHDARPGGPASAAYPNLGVMVPAESTRTGPGTLTSRFRTVAVSVLVLAAVGATWTWLAQRRPGRPHKPDVPS